MADADAVLRGADAHPDVAALVGRAKEGDLGAFERLVALHERQVLRTAHGLLGDREDARDAAQEAFLRMFRYLARFDATRELAPWLYRLTVNVCRDLSRRRGPAPTVSLDDLPDAVLVEPAAQDGRTDAGDRARLLRRALAALTVTEREAVVLRDLQGLSTGETARALGCRETTVRSHLSRGRLKLRDAVMRLQGGAR